MAATLFLGAYAWPILDPELPAWADQGCSILTWTVWAIFAVDLVVRLCLAERRGAFLRRNWPDLVTLALPMLRPLRAVIALNVLGRRGRVFARGRVVAYVGAAVTIVGFVAALAVLDSERASPDRTIHTIGDGLWWAATTVTTVGYGDRYPTTAEGRFVGVGLMVTGIALLGVVTAALASWFVEKVNEARAVEERTEASVAEIARELRSLRRALEERGLVSTDQPAPDSLDVRA